MIGLEEGRGESSLKRFRRFGDMTKLWRLGLFAKGLVLQKKII
jgi:hypothetical protein